MLLLFSLRQRRKINNGLKIVLVLFLEFVFECNILFFKFFKKVIHVVTLMVQSTYLEGKIITIIFFIKKTYFYFIFRSLVHRNYGVDPFYSNALVTNNISILFCFVDNCRFLFGLKLVSIRYSIAIGKSIFFLLLLLFNEFFFQWIRIICANLAEVKKFIIYFVAFFCLAFFFSIKIKLLTVTHQPYSNERELFLL